MTFSLWGAEWGLSDAATERKKKKKNKRHALSSKARWNAFQSASTRRIGEEGGGGEGLSLNNPDCLKRPPESLRQGTRTVQERERKGKKNTPQ